MPQVYRFVNLFQVPPGEIMLPGCTLYGKDTEDRNIEGTRTFWVYKWPHGQFQGQWYTALPPVCNHLSSSKSSLNS